MWPILADPVQVEQSIVNLAINARDAMPNGGTLQITARNAPRPKGERRPDGEVRPGDYVQITVTDTGIGMDEATRTRMFEPFFTTKPHGQGTGLGLSTVYGFVRQCGGSIGVLSTPGKGTSIELLLPRAADGAAGHARIAPAIRGAAGEARKRCSSRKTKRPCGALAVAIARAERVSGDRRRRAAKRRSSSRRHLTALSTSC